MEEGGQDVGGGGPGLGPDKVDRSAGSGLDNLARSGSGSHVFAEQCGAGPGSGSGSGAPVHLSDSLPLREVEGAQPKEPGHKKEGVCEPALSCMPAPCSGAVAVAVAGPWQQPRRGSGSGSSIALPPAGSSLPQPWAVRHHMALAAAGGGPAPASTQPLSLALSIMPQSPRTGWSWS